MWTVKPHNHCQNNSLFFAITVDLKWLLNNHYFPNIPAEKSELTLAVIAHEISFAFP